MKNDRKNYNIQNRKHRNREWIPFLLPGLAGVSIFVLLPFLDVVRRSFFTALGGNFVGIDNYMTIFHNQAFCLAMKNTLHFLGICLPLLVILSLVMAVMLSRAVYRERLKAMFLFPMAVPTAAVVVIWKMFFYRQGLLNGLLDKCGITGPDWLGSSYAFYVLVASYLWKNLGYTIVLWLTGILQISDGLYEAARMDGAREDQIFFWIILPNLRNTFYMVVILSFVNSFKVFREAYLVAGSYPDESMYMMQHLFNNWFTNLDLDKMAAAAVVVTLLLVSVVILLEGIVWRKCKK